MTRRPWAALLLALLLGACALPSPPPPAAEPPTAGPGATPTPAAERAVPPRPTATPYATPRPQAGRYTNDDRGVRLTFPRGWQSEPGEEETSLIWIYPDDRSVFTLLFTSTMIDGETLEDEARAIHEQTTQGLSDVALLSEGATQVADGRAAWATEYRGTRDDGSELQMRIVSAARRGTLFTLMSFGAPADLDASRKQLEQISASLELRGRLRYGIPEDQALLEQGGESNNPRDYDPAHAGGSSYLYSGLVQLTPDLQAVPDLASGWEISDDGRVYTFHLRPQARFHNGRPVTADDVIYSWDRALDPATDSNYGLTYLGDIVGAADRRSGEAQRVSGLRAIDAHTLEVTIDAPKPYFLAKLSYRVAAIVDRQSIASGAEWYRTPNGTGPYRLARWDWGELRIYERNPDFYLDPPAIPYVIEQIYAGTGLQLYERDDIDTTYIGGFNLERARDPQGPWPGQLREIVNLCTSYIGLDARQPPFDDPAVRRAFALAVDRTQIATIQQGGLIAGRGLYPPALPGYSAELRGQRFDPQAARASLAESRYRDAAGLPPITFTASGYGSDISRVEAALADMWQQHLGVAITFENIEPERWEEVMHSGRHGQLYSYGWCADYPDPENFADTLFHSGAEQNLGGFSSPELDELLVQARSERDVAARIRLYQQAEQLLVDQAAAIFLGHSRSFVLVKPRLTGYVLTPMNVPIERYLAIDPQAE